MQVINCSSFELNTFLSLLSFVVCFLLLLNRCTDGGRAHRGEAPRRNVDTNPRLQATHCPLGCRIFQKIPRRNYYQVTFDVAIEAAGYVLDTSYCLEHRRVIRPIGNSDPKEHLIFPDYPIYRTWNLLRKHWRLFSFHQYNLNYN
jgi:hypothetical protein